ncbi:MAG TPA: hypothetical protein VGP07_09775 [Polyangia bacterium]|jgi:hypothetical protein
MSALSLPAPGATIKIGFETDAAGVPLPRLTVLGEQYADLGVHFHGGYLIGDRATDFSDYVVAPTPDNFICTPEGGVPSGCGAPQDKPAQGVPLEITLDFPLCYASIFGRGLASYTPGQVGIAGFDANGFETSSWGSRLIQSVVMFDPATLRNVFIQEGVGPAWLPPSLGFTGSPAPIEGLDVHRLEVNETTVGSYDDLTLTRCIGLQPKCKDQVLCTSPAQQCVGGGPVSIDNGSYNASNDQPVTVTQTPAGPYALGSNRLTLTVSQGTATATCGASVAVGDCSAAPSLVCPPPATLECQPSSNGICTPYTAAATATDLCQVVTVAPDSNCMALGSNSPRYNAASVNGLTSTCTTPVTVVDTKPPVITINPLSPENDVLTPADGTMRVVALDTCGVQVQDQCEGGLNADAVGTITCVTSDQDCQCVQTSDDIQIVSNSTVNLRAMTNSNGKSRVYTIHFEAGDQSGNTAAGSCVITVPGAGGASATCRPVGSGGAGGGTASGGRGGAAGATGGGGIPGSGGRVGSGGAPGSGGMNGAGGRATSGGGAGGSTSGSAGSYGSGGASAGAGGAGSGGQGHGGVTGGVAGRGGANGGAGANGGGGAAAPGMGGTVGSDAGIGYDGGAKDGATSFDAGTGNTRGGCDVAPSQGPDNLSLLSLACILALTRGLVRRRSRGCGTARATSARSVV